MKRLVMLSVIGAGLVPGLLLANCGSCGKDKAGDEGKGCAARCESKAGSCAAKTPCAPANPTDGVATLEPAALAALIKAGTPAVILDARTGKYDDGKRVPGAKALAPEASAEDAAKVAPDKKALVVTYCANTHCPASGKLAAHLRELGYENVVEMPKGIAGWVEAGNAVVDAK